MSAPTPDNVLTIAIVGCGIIARNHAAALELIPDVRIVALIDVDRAQADLLVEGLQKHPEAPAFFTSIEEMAAAGVRPDLISITTPSGLHAQQLGAALDTGAHVVVEKPLDANLAVARKLAARARDARENGQISSVISQHRFDPASVDVHRAVEAGELGKVTSAVATVPWWRGKEYYDSAAWRGTWALDGGALLNQSVHTLDLLIWMLGTPIEVTARYARLAHDIEAEDTLVATIAFEGGALAVLHATTAAFPGLQVRLQVHGTQGSAVIEADELKYIHLANKRDPEAEWVDDGDQSAALGTPVEIPEGVSAFVYGHHRQYLDIIAAIREGRDPGITVDDACLTLAVAHAIYAAASTGRTIVIADVLAGAEDDIEFVVPDFRGEA